LPALKVLYHFRRTHSPRGARGFRVTPGDCARCVIYCTVDGNMAVWRGVAFRERAATILDPVPNFDDVDTSLVRRARCTRGVVSSHPVKVVNATFNRIV